MNIVSALAPTGSSTVQLTSIGVGSTTNYAVATSVTFNSSAFLSASFTATASGMAGGLYSPAGTTAGSAQYVYSPSGAKIATLQNGQLVKGTVPLPGGGTAIYTAGGFGYFRHKDWLGSSLLATRWDHSVYSKEAYAPFGEAENNMEAGTPDRSFTGQDQDTTNGVYDYLFRKYDPVAGRWMSPDPSGLYYADPTNPQSLNLYAYVLNNVLVAVDPDGLECVWDDGSYDSADDPDTGSQSQCEGGNTGGHWIDPKQFAALGYSGSSQTPDQWLAGLTAVSANVNGGVPSDMEMGNLGLSLEMSDFTPTPSWYNFVRMPLPSNALSCSTNTGVNFYAPPGFSVGNIAANGKTNGLLGAHAAVAEDGYYDYQRFRAGADLQFYPSYTPVANIAVGAYLAGTGASTGTGSLISNGYATVVSSNGATAQQAQFRKLGFDLASGKATYSCH